MIDPAPKPPSPVELRMHQAMIRAAGERKMAFTVQELGYLAHRAAMTLLPPRPRDGEQPRGPRRPMAGPASAPAAREGTSAPTETSERPTGRERALQGLRSEPTACAVLALIGDGSTDREITARLGLEKSQARNVYRRWLYATDSLGRAALGAWARQNTATVEPGAAR